jgi:putative metalloprotease
MLKLTPLLIAVAYGLVAYLFSSWRLKAKLNEASTPLSEPSLAPLLTDMARALDVPQIKAFVYEISTINGLAAPDGRIFLTRGMLDKYKAGEIDAAEIASVIAHELGHVALGHTKRRMVDFSGQNAVRAVLIQILGRIIPGLGIMLANFLTSILAAKMSQSDEYEADAYASALLTKAGIGTGGQKTLLLKLGKMGGGGGMPAWLLSHPKPAARVAAIETNERRWRV